MSHLKKGMSDNDFFSSSHFGLGMGMKNSILKFYYCEWE